MTKTKSPQAKTPFPSAPTVWNWNECPTGGVPGRDRCQSVSTKQEREQAEALIAAYREQEAIIRANDIESRQNELTRLKGIGAELMKREISACDHGKWEAGHAKLAELRQEALELVTPMIRRVLVHYSESLAQTALEAEARLEANGLPIRAGNQWTLHEDSICRALWSCRIKVEKALFEIQPLSAVGATQFFLTSEDNVPFNWPS